LQLVTDNNDDDDDEDMRGPSRSDRSRSPISKGGRFKKDESGGSDTSVYRDRKGK
jgi:hypothetical protein